MVRLVKGAYWDTEVKRAQERGLADYPVFTRKAMTDLCYDACMRKLLAAARGCIPQFATHNALTVASVIEDAGGVEGYEFQRLHGMGEVLYETLRAEFPRAAVRVYAPVGGHKDLLAYLVRRLLENGANSSFVAVAADPSVPVEALLKRPQGWIGDAAQARHPNIPLPRDLYGPERRNSAGVEFGHEASLDALLPRCARRRTAARALAEADEGGARGDGGSAGGISRVAGDAGRERAAILERAGDLMQERGAAALIALMQREGGKTLDDCVPEVREAVDFCRYYAVEARRALAPQRLPGPTGESNELRYRGRGVFVCISPWNFPLSIFTGQVAAALAAGNTVAAKPAEQTPLVAAEAVRILHEAGVPPEALHLVPGDGKIGAALVADRRTAGVAFTGSTEVARAINRVLAGKDQPDRAADRGDRRHQSDDRRRDRAAGAGHRRRGHLGVPLGRPALLGVAAALRAGGRGRPHVEMIAGAARELKLGDPRDPSTHVGPVIDAEAKEKLDRWIATMDKQGRVRFRWDAFKPLPDGLFVPPTIMMLDRARDLKEEVFGPVLHVVRWRADGSTDCSTTSPATATRSLSGFIRASTTPSSRSSRASRTAMSTSTAA